ncbi:MAG: hypothetical protein OXD43_06685 [Bacteroidetes bacterium]|nr:hypothetical protein [Bacteroidota bacterium]
MSTLSSVWGRRARLGKRATNVPRRLTGVLVLARMEDQGSSNTGSPVGAEAHGDRNSVRSRPGRQGGGVVRSTGDAG